MPKNIYTILKFIVPASLLLALLFICTGVESAQQFTYLSDSFLHGQTHFLEHVTSSGVVIGDSVLYHGKYYWPLGPFPAIILMPFVATFKIFGLFFYQGFLQVFLVIALFFVLIKLGRKLDYSKEDSVTLSFGFILASMFIGVATISSSWFFAQVLTTLLQFYCIYEFYTRRRWWLIGMALGMVVATRFTAVLIILFFMFEIWGSNEKQRLKNLTKVVLPVVLAVICLAVYNYVRFHSFTEQGYHNQILRPELFKQRAYGLFSLLHVPGNLFYAFINGPVPVFRDSLSHVLKFPYIKADPWGMSILITSPYLFYLFKTRKSQLDQRAKHILITILITMVPIFTYYGIGYRQYGYRYALDFMPLTFLLFMLKYREKHKRITPSMNLLLLGWGVFNMYLLTTILQ